MRRITVRADTAQISTPDRVSDWRIDDLQRHTIKTGRRTALNNITLPVGIAFIVHDTVTVSIQRRRDHHEHVEYMMLGVIVDTRAIRAKEMFRIGTCRVNTSPVIHGTEEEEAHSVVTVAVVRGPD